MNTAPVVRKMFGPPGPIPGPGASGADPIRKYRCLRNKRPSKPYEFIGFGAMDVTKLYKFIWFGDSHGPKAYTFIGFGWAFISQTPVVLVTFQN